MLAIVRSQTVSIRIAWRRQHQFSLITAVSQPARETGSAIARLLFWVKSSQVTIINNYNSLADNSV
ncbi:hypothetical protein [Nostoc commune]|uniref:hypothetical protein n=1 Tax=Nostoc commune TaxID=1178 RepID=UPI0018C743AB|nr:hypothetical protein [Nostoc commune]MBG1259853.1 hypothetical protein [Nostoc commune BAE]